METHLVCPDCNATHQNPADARLGHVVCCMECALTVDFLSAPRTIDDDADIKVAA
jgi:hydrogenase maturation factor HypF (carbamoyltransferase family)